MPPANPFRRLLAALAAFSRRRRWRRRRRRRRSLDHRRRRRRRYDRRWRWRRSRVSAQRQHDLEVAAVAGDVAVELALVTDPQVNRSNLAANRQAGEERALLLRRRHDVEVAAGVAEERRIEPRAAVAEAVAVAKVGFGNHSTQTRRTLDA